MSTTTVNIAILGTTSTVASIGVEVESLVGLSTDSAFTTSDISFSVCQTVDGTYLPLKMETGAVYKITSGAASSYYALDYLKFLGARYIKVIATSQSSATVITLVSKLIK